MDEDELIGRSATLQSAVETHLRATFERLAKTPVSPVFPGLALTPIFDEVRALTLAGGKRIRAILLLEATALFDPQSASSTTALDAAVAIELLHCGYLIFDDVIDGDAVRRGRPSAHIGLGALCADPERGSHLAVVAGVFASALSQHVMMGLELPAERHVALMKHYAAMQAYAVEGGAIELLEAADPIESAVRKTAAYSFMGPLVMGAVLGGASADAQAQLASAGRDLGLAFQLVDDLLGVFGDAVELGKPVGSDLVNQRPTWLVQRGLALANDGERAAIQGALTSVAGPREIEAARKAIESCGARQACELEIERLSESFVRKLDAVGGTPAASAFLASFAHALASRRH